MTKKAPQIIIIGAGLTGLAFAYRCRKPYVILEKEKQPGGLCRSIYVNGFTFDHSGHFLHLHRPETQQLFAQLIPDLARVKRESWIFTHNTYIPYPFQAHLYGLPGKVKKECVEGFLERPAVPSVANPDFYRWSLGTFGKGITDHFMKPYNEKLWTVSSRSLATDWVAPFVPQPSREEVINSARSPKTGNFGYNVQFYYPKAGGSQVFVNAFADRTDNLKLSVSVEKVNYRNKYIETSAGEKIYYDRLVSTEPLPGLLDRMGSLPAGVAAARKKLNWNSVCSLNLAVRQNGKKKWPAQGKHWIYFPEKKYAFYRTGIYSNVMPSMAPRGYASFYVEISHRPDEPLDGEKSLERVFDGLKDAGIICRDDTAEIVNRLPIPYAYVIYDAHRQAALEVIQQFLKKHDIHSIGRYGGWKYSFMEESVVDGGKLAEKLNS